MAERVCPKCGGAMEVGFMVDQAYGGVAKPKWAEGAIEWSKWVGVKTKGKTMHEVETYACGECGFLESYLRRTAAG